MDNIAWLKRTLSGHSEQGVLDMGFPSQAEDIQGTNELAAFMQDLQAMFGESGCSHHHKDQVMECGAEQTGAHCGKLSIAFPPEYAKHPRPPRRHETFCKPKELLPSSSVFTFSPDEFQRAAVFLDGQFSHGGVVTVDRAADDDDTQDVKVNVTTYVGRKELQDQISISGFDHEGQYSVQVKRKGGHHCRHRKPPVKEDCVTYSIHVVFPSHLESYEDLDLHIRKALRIHTSTDLTKLTFGKFRAGVGHGAINFSDLKAEKIMLGSLYGVVMGDYSPTQTFAGAAVHGASKVKIHPASEHVNVTSAAVVGPASAELSANEFSGNFIVSSWTGSPIVKAPNPDDIHVVKNRYTYKAGYYKEKETGSNVIVSSKHGDSELIFKGDDGDGETSYEYMY
ncbi:hypothetical protein BDB00DRAFT_850433 [Zychaea mexicana]|uniref:uncharacterized protein n=1 Tax=Zychaea mexicana TaxID=64656 RepID=UPI0022FE024E|nr:uncharacterized protein BDB00DRAFT_850433 [Zychaea mexicana]KAI9488047.1 hypothetical protein BDB00DRAFT_850433 [Zychaea mexicana]